MTFHPMTSLRVIYMVWHDNNAMPIANEYKYIKRISEQILQLTSLQNETINLIVKKNKTKKIKLSTRQPNVVLSDFRRIYIRHRHNKNVTVNAYFQSLLSDCFPHHK